MVRMKMRAGEKTKSLPDKIIMMKEMLAEKIIIMTKEMPAEKIIIMMKEMPVDKMMKEKMVVENP